MSNGSEHTPERCVHAVDGPDWAGLRELYPAEVDYTEMVAEARDYAKWSNETRYGNLSHTGMIFELADAVESLLAIEQRLTDHIVQLAAERDALQTRLDAMTVEYLPGMLRQRLVGPWTVVPEGDTNA